MVVVMRIIVCSLESGVRFSFPKAGCWPHLMFIPSWLCEIERGSHLFNSHVLTDCLAEPTDLLCRVRGEFPIVLWKSLKEFKTSPPEMCRFGIKIILTKAIKTQQIQESSLSLPQLPEFILERGPVLGRRTLPEIPFFLRNLST